MTDETPPPQLDAYALLTKPTLELTDGEVETIIADLRKRRTTYLATNKADSPKKEAAAKAALAAPAPTAEQKRLAKQEATRALMASIELPGLL